MFRVTSYQALGLECISTMVLVLTVFAICDTKQKMPSADGPMAVAMAVTLGHLILIPFTGCSINPARSLGTRYF